MFESKAERLRRQQLNRDLDSINTGINDQRSSSDQNTRPLVSSIGTNPNFGEKLQRQDISGSIWNKMETGKSKHLYYPLNLGTDDVENFLFIKIYQGHSESFITAEKKLQKLEWTRDRLDEINAMQSESARNNAISAFENEALSNGDFLDDNQSIEFSENSTGKWTANISTHTDNNKDKIKQTLTLEKQIQWAEGQKGIQEDSDAHHRDSWRFKQELKGSRAGSMQTRRVKKEDFPMQETIALYLPQKLNVAGMNTYDSPDFSTIGDIQGMANLDMKAFEGTILRKGAGMADAVADIIGAETNLKRAYAAWTGRVVNPRRETLFVSPEMRKFEFAFEFTPRNYEESISVDNIIKTLRKHAYPRLQLGGYFYHMPAEFQLEYYQVTPDGSVSPNKWLNRILPCVLQEVNVDYTGSGQVSMFENGAPTHINMTLSFQEVELLHQDRIIDGY